MLPKLPKNIYRIYNTNKYKISFGDFYFIIKDSTHPPLDRNPIGTLLVEINYSEGIEPGVHWNDDNYVSAVPVEAILGKKEFEYGLIGYKKSTLVKVKNNKHYLELILKYANEERILEC